MKLKVLSLFVLIALLSVVGVFLGSKTAEASCDPSGGVAGATSPTVNITQPTGVYQDPGSISLVVTGQGGYFCSGSQAGGFGWDEVNTNVTYSIRNSSNQVMYSGNWQTTPTCTVPICAQRDININVSVPVSSWPAGTYTVQVDAMLQSSAYPALTGSDSENFTIEVTPPSATLTVYNAFIPLGSGSVNGTYKCRVFNAPNGYEVTANNYPRSITTSLCTNQNKTTTVYPGDTTFYVYTPGVAEPLAQATMTASCADAGATIINGVCAFPPPPSSGNSGYISISSANNSGGTVTVSGTATGGRTFGGAHAGCNETPNYIIFARTLNTPTQYSINGGASNNFTLNQTQAGANGLVSDCGGYDETRYQYSFSFNFSASGLSPGTHSVAVSAFDQATGATIYSSPATFTVSSPSGWIVPLYSECTIPDNQSSCSVSGITWETTDPLAGVTSQVVSATATPSPVTANSKPSPGQTFSNIVYGDNWLTLYHNGQEIEQARVVGKCTFGSSDYVGGVCRARPIITASAGANGSISPSGMTSVIYNSVGHTYTITPSSGYSIASVLVNGSNIGAVSSYTFNNVTSDQTISASFTPSSCANGAINPPACTECPAGSAMINGTCTPVTISCSATTPYNVLPGTTVNFAYSASTNYGSTQSRLLNNSMQPLTAYQANSPIPYTVPNSIGQFAYYVQCQNSNPAFSNVNDISNQVIVNTACPAGQDFVSGQCRSRLTVYGVAGTGGTISPASQEVVYQNTADLTVTPNAGYTISSVTASGCTVGLFSGNIYRTGQITTNCTVTASFSANAYSLNVSKTGTGAGTVNGTSSPSQTNISCGSTCSASYNYNTSVTLTATPNAGSSFTGWSGDCSGTGSCNVYMTQARNVTANFTANPSGTINATNCPIAIGASTCNAIVSWTTQNLTAGATEITRNQGTPYSFTPSPLASGSQSVTLGNGTTIFYLYHNINGVPTLLAQTSGTASSGTGYCTAGGTWDGTMCVAVPVVTVTATPSSVAYNGSSTISWTAPTATSCSYNGSPVSAPSGSFGTGPLTASTSYTIYCNNVAGTGSGSASVAVAGQPSGALNATGCTIASGASSCNGSVSWTTQNLTAGATEITRNPGTPNFTPSPLASGSQSVSLTYTNTNFYLYHNISGTPTILAQDSITPGIEISCTANTTWNGSICAPNTHTLTVTKVGSGAGTVSSSPAGINCGATCSASYNYNIAVTLTATPNAGSVFSGWSGDADCSDGSVTMSSARNCTATFSNGPSGTLSASTCVVPNGSSICVSTLGVTTANLNSPNGTNTQITRNPSGTCTNCAYPFTSPVTAVVSYGQTTNFFLYHNGAQLATASVTPGMITCQPGSSWDGDTCEPTASPSGTLSASNCTIAIGQSTCTTTLTQTTANLVSPNSSNTTITRNPSGTCTNCAYPFTSPVTAVVGYATTNFYLYHNGALLAQDSLTPGVEITCENGGSWDGDTCEPTSSPSGTINATNCTIPNGGSTCSASVSWTTANLTKGDTEITRNYGSPNFVPEPPSSGSQGVTLTYGLNGTTTFYLYHNIDGTPTILDQTDAGTGVANCAVGSAWDGDTCEIVLGPYGTLSASSCTIASGQSSCTTNLTVTTGNLNSPNSSNTAITRNPSGTCTNCTYAFTNPVTAVVSYTTTNFYLYHNAVLLAQDSLIPGLDVTCEDGTSWDGDSCEDLYNPTDGVCATPPNGGAYSEAPLGPLCSAGTASPSSLSGKGPWDWMCNGIDGGSDASCSASQAEAGCAALDANPISIYTGGSTTLEWSSCATSCTGTAPNNFTGGAPSGSLVVSPTYSTTYAISCDDDSNSTASVNVVVRKKPIFIEN